MIKTTAVSLANPEPMMVTWDLGRRCNLDCTYCEASRHDNFSSHASLESLIETYKFIKNWTGLYNSKRLNNSRTTINFTGGEPTVNPNIWKLAEYIKNDDSSFNLALTTNGAWTSKNTDKIAALFNGISLSYHPEAHATLKEQTKNNIKLLHEKDLWLQVYVMLHADHFKECMELCYELATLGIRHTPKPIGDGTSTERVGWFKDTDGTMRRSTHSYTVEQQMWLNGYLGTTNAVSEPRYGTGMGRTCCGGRCTKGKINNEWQVVKLIDTNFKGWNCSVDWFFLHINQQLGLVYHHQTCQALHNNKRGPIGSLSEAEKLLSDLKERLENPTNIVCPNQRCGCGMCVPKAEDSETFKELMSNIASS